MEHTAQQPDRRRFLRDGAYLAAAAALLAGEASGAEVPASSVPFANLEPQPPINIRADAYGQTALNLSRLAAMTTRCKLDIAYGSAAAQRLDVYMPADITSGSTSISRIRLTSGRARCATG